MSPERARQTGGVSPPNQLYFGTIVDLQTKLHRRGEFPESPYACVEWQTAKVPNPAPGITWGHRGFCSVPLLLVHHFFHLPDGGVFKKTASGEVADGASDPTVQLTFENPPLVGVLGSPLSDPPSPQRPRLHGHLPPQPQSFPEPEAMPRFPLNVFCLEKLCDFFA